MRTLSRQGRLSLICLLALLATVVRTSRAADSNNEKLENWSVKSFDWREDGPHEANQAYGKLSLNTDPAFIKSGEASLRLEAHTAKFDGTQYVQMSLPGLQSPAADADALSVWVYGAQGAGKIAVKLFDARNWKSYEVSLPLAFSGWKKIVLPRSDFQRGRPDEPEWKNVNFLLLRAFGDFTVYLDDLKFEPAQTAHPTPDAEAAAVPGIEVTPDGQPVGAAHKIDFPHSKADVLVLPRSYMEREATAAPESPVKIFAAPGEFEPFCFDVWTRRDLPAVTVEVEEFRGRDKTRVLPQRQVTIRSVETRNRWLDFTHFVRTPEYLPLQRARTIPRQSLQRYWATVQVPEQAAGGTYRSRVLVKSGGKVVATLPVQLEVLPLRLPAPADVATNFMYFNTNLLPEPLRNQEYQRRCFDDMKRHGMSSTTVYLYPQVSKDGKSVIGMDKGGSASMGVIPTLEAIEQSGLTGGKRPVIWIGGSEVGSAPVWQAVLDEAARRHWPELLFYEVDEPETDARIALVREVMGRINEYRKLHPEHKIRTVTAIGKKGIAEVGDDYDVWIIPAQSLTPEIQALAAQKKKEVWAYNCVQAPMDARLARYYFGLWAWKAGVQGCSYWAYADDQSRNRFYDASTGWDDLERFAARDGKLALPFSFVYPSLEEPVPSIGWEGVREGVDDLRYIRTLESLIVAARRNGQGSAAPVARAENLLRRMSDRIKLGGLAQSYAVSQTGAQARWPFQQGVPQPEITAEEYDRFRYQVAQEIRALQKLAGA